MNEQDISNAVRAVLEQMKGTGSGRMLPQKIQFRIREKDGLWQPSFLRGFYSDKAEKERN